MIPPVNARMNKNSQMKSLPCPTEFDTAMDKWYYHNIPIFGKKIIVPNKHKPILINGLLFIFIFYSETAGT